MKVRNLFWREACGGLLFLGRLSHLLVGIARLATSTVLQGHLANERDVVYDRSCVSNLHLVSLAYDVRF